MSKLSPELELMEVSTPEARLDFIFSTFSESSINSIILKNINSDKSLGDMWAKKAVALASLVVSALVYRREIKKESVSKATFNECLGLEYLVSLSKDGDTPELLVVALKEYLKELAGYSDKAKKQNQKSQESHGYLSSIINHLLEVVIKKLHGRQALSGATRSPRKGDVIAEGPGFDVVVGHKQQSVIRYTEGRTGIILMHDPRDGHFLLVERYSDVDGGYVLEFPKAFACTMQDKETAASIALREQTSLSLRDLEKIGEIRPDNHMIDGVVEVFYGTFDLEESYGPGSRLVRDVKRINEEGLYQAAYDGKMNCAQTLSAISIWHAFESVRKKRVANSKRVRGPKAVDQVESEDGEE